MPFPVKIKVCGLTREADVDLAIAAGADFCGFIVYPKSPRALALPRATDLAAKVPQGGRVIVDVDTSKEDILSYRDAGFDFFQIHLRAEPNIEAIAEYSNIVGRERLWLAPRLAPNQNFPEAILEYTDTILVDTYTKDQIGGTGKTGDWTGFKRLSERFAQSKFILAGGLSPQNIVDAVSVSGASHIDINSGIESAPGIKDSEKLQRAFRSLRA